MSYRKNYFAKITFALFLLCPFLSRGQTVLFEEDWQQDNNWTRVEFRVFGIKPISNTWFRDQNGPQGSRAIAKINSTTPNNIAAIFDSGVICQNPYGDNAWIISPPLSATNVQQVILNFNTFYRSYNDRPQIRVGTELNVVNNTITDRSLESWATYEVFPGIQASQYGGELVGSDSTLNPQPISIDISDAAAGEETFYVAFQYLSDASTINGGNDPFFIGCGHSWQIDDIQIIADPSFNDISCGEGVVVQGGNKNNIGSYSCGEGYPGNDNVFRFEITEPATVLIELDNELTNATNLDLFFLQDNNNAPGNCLASSESGTSEEELTLNLTAGVYWISVDQVDANSGPAMLNLSINCFPNESPLQIACGETLVGTNTGAANTASATQINECFGGSAPFGYTGGDRRYQFTVIEESTVFFQFPTHGSGNVDAFIFSDNNGQLGSCQARSSGPSEDQLVAALLPGTYWILIDSPDPAGEASFDLSLNCFPVDNRTLIACGDVFTSSTSGEGDNFGDPNYLGCLSGTVPPYDAGDRVYQFTLPAQPLQQTVSLNLVDLIDRQLKVFLLDSEGGQPGTCRAVGLLTGAPGESRIMETLDAGATYWVIVDGESDFKEGPFELSLKCFPAQTDELGTITSGVPVEGNSIGSIDDFAGPGNVYSGGDQAYSFEVQGNPQQILLSLSSQGIGALDLFLYPDAGGRPDTSGDPLAQSTQDSLENEVLFLILDVGKYWVIVDSKEAPIGSGIKSNSLTKSSGPPLSDGGPYTLILNVAALQTLCDLDESMAIRSGNAITSRTGTPLLQNDNSAEAGIIPSDVIAKVDCIEGAFPPQAGQQPKISGNIYTYYHEVAGSFTIEVMDGTAAGVKVLVFKCEEDNRSAACLGVLENGARTFNEQAGYYTILVGSETPNLSFTIQLTSENQCVPEVQTPIAGLSELTVDLQGMENDFTRDKYLACFNGITKLYDGPDRIYTFEVRNRLNESGEEQLLTLELSDIDASAAVGLFLFKDLCEGNCRAFAEYDPNSPDINKPGYPSFRINELESGIYYLVVDQAAAGPPIANFNLKFNQVVQNQAPSVASFFHNLSFRNVLPPPNVDKVFITYDRANLNFAEANFINQEITVKNDGTLQDTKIPFAGPYKGGPKRGYDDNEKFLLFGRRGTTELPLEAVFSQSKPDASNRFRKNGDSQITKLNTIMIEQTPSLQLDPKTVDIPPTQNEKYPILVSTNQDWVILDTSLPDDWVAIEKTSGKQGENISLNIAANDSKIARQTFFKVQVTDPVTNFKKTELVKITQRGVSNTCTNNQIQFQNIVVDDTCPGNAEGSMSFSVSGISGTPQFSWSNGLDDRAAIAAPVGGTYTVNVPGLLPGIYSVTVSDANKCQGSAKIDIPNIKYPEPQITGDLNFCAGNSADLSAGTFNTYLWSTGATTSTIAVTQADTYSVTVTDANGCEGSDQVMVTVNTMPEPQITGELSFCAGGNTNLSVGAFNTYLWSTGATTASITVTQAGTYSVTVTGANGCEGSDQVMVTVNPLPDPQITGALSFCAGGSTNLSVGQFNTYLWSTGATTAAITVTEADTYSVTVTDGNGCSGSDQVTVTVNALPEPQITGTLSFCAGSSTNLSVGAFNTYLWSTGATTPTITVTQADTYSVTVTDANGCSGSDQVTVTVNALPEPQISGALSFCAGGNTELSVGAFSTYLWSNGATTPAITVTQANTYSVTVTDANGCSGSDQVTVMVSPQLEPQITGTSSFCAGGSTELSVGPFSTYLWSTGATTAAITVTQADTYSVTVTDANGCSGSDQVTVTVNALPEPQITGALNFCAGGSTNLSVGAFNTYLWSTGATTAAITVTEADTYSVTVTDANGCAGSDQVTVTVNALPQPEITGTLSLCFGGSTNLSVGQFNTYLWSTGATTAGITVTQAGTYSVTVTDTNGCSGSDQVTVTVNPLPEPQISGALSFCAGSSTNLSVGTFNTYLWSTGATTPSITVTQANTYSVTVTDANGCSGSDQVAVTVSPQLEPEITGTLSFCAGGSTELSVGPFNTYLWSTGAATPTITVTQADTYSVTVTDANGCSGSDQVMVTVNALPNPQITGALNFCAGGSTNLSVGAFNTYLWSTGATTAAITVTQADTYSVTVTDANGCSGSDQVTVTVNALPEPQITGPLSFCAGSSANLSVGAFNTYLWSTGATTPTITVTQADTYSVTVTDANGCSGSDQVTVTVNALPEPQISGALSFCAGGNTELSVGAFSTYLWSNGATTPAITVTQANTYSVTVTDANGCSGSDQVTVMVSPQLEPQITGTSSFCAGGSTELSVGPFSTYLWSTGATTAAITVTQADTYSVTVTDANGCSGSDQVTVTVNALPEPQITGALNFCAGGSTNLSVGPFNTYLWSTGATTAAITVTEADTYSVTVTDANGCAGSDQVTVTVNALPEPQVSGELSFCAGGNTNLSVGPFNTYLWSTGATTAAITVTQADTYSVTVTDTNGCSGSDQVTVTVNPLPEPEITGALSFCAGGSTELSVSAFDAYLWSTGATTASITVEQSGTYSVTVTDSNGCQGTDEVNVSRNPLPKPQIAGSLSICSGSNTTLDAGSFAQYLWSTGAVTQSITVEGAGDYSVTVTDANGCTGQASVTVVESESLQPQITGSLSFCTGSSTMLDAGNFVEYLWSNEAATQTISVSAAGSYSVTVTDQNGCTGTASVSVTENPLPEPVIEGDLSICAGQSTALSVGEFTDYLWSTGGLNRAITVTEGGIYGVTVTDENGCQGSAEVTVTLNALPEPQITGGLSFCADGSTELSAGTFAAYRWSNGATTASITVEQTGTYSVTVTDANGCEGTDQVNVSSNPLPAPQIAGSLSICAGGNTTLDAGSFAQYLWSTGAVTQSITVEGAGDYSVTVTDANGCTGQASVTVVESESLQPQITGTLSFCTGSSTMLDAGNFAQYLWSNEAVTQTISVSTAGDYSVTVTDQSGCTGTASVSVAENPLPEPVIEGDLSICAGGSTTLRVGEFADYLWSIGGLNDSITVTQAGTYSVTVTDENGCQGSAQVTVTLNPLPEPQISGELSFCAGDSTDLSAGTFAAYLWSNGATTASITVKQAGTYSVTVTDDNGCEGSDQVNVTSNPLPEPQIAGSLSICAGGSTTLDAGSFAQYLWSNGAATQSITVDAAGEYSVTVTNDNGCIGEAAVTVTESESLQPQIIGTLSFCTGRSTMLDAGNFAQYLWSNEAVTQTISVSTAGDYSVTVTDQNGCTGTASVSVTENPLPEPVIEGALSICAGGSTTLRVGEFTEYLWSIGALTSSITVTQAGTYSVTITDENGCEGSAEVTVTVNPLPAPQLTGELSFCAGDSTELNAGTFAAYLWSNGATTASIVVKQAGTYSVTVTDDNGCEGSAQVNVSSNPLPEPQISGSLSICAGGSTTLDAGSFAGYLWSNGAVTQAITVEAAGAYSVTVTDANGCTGQASVTVIESESLQPQITGPLSFCIGSSTILDAGNFTQYLWSNEAVTQTISVSTAGDYSVTVTDQNGCTGTASVSVAENPLPEPVIEGNLSLCAGESTTLRVGEFADYLWSIGGLNDSITVNQAGTYSVTVTDENGCPGSAEVTVTVNPLPEPQISGELSFCAGDSTELTVGAFAAYLWSNGATTASITVKQTGTYSVTVTDDNGCQGADQINVTSNPVPVPQITGSLSICTGSSTVLDAGDFPHYLWSTGDTTQFITVENPGEFAVTATNDNGCTGEASVTVVEGESLQPQITGPLSFCAGSSTILDAGDFAQYLWSDGATTQTISVSTVGDYSVTVTDANGCTGETTVSVTESELPQPQITGTLSFCAGASAQLSVGDFEAYLWSDGATSQSITVSTAGDYSVTVTDANGCTGVDTVQVTVIGTIALVINSVTNVSCAGGADGAIAYEVSGGEGPLTVVWSDADGPIDSLVNLSAGNYTVEVSDGTDCGFTDVITISEPLKLELFLSVIDETADDADDGSINAQISGGTPPYELLWSNGSTEAMQSDLAPGKYNVTLTDAAGCTVRDSVFLNPFSCSPLVELTPVPVSCAGGADGSASLEILGGDIPLDIKWSNGSTAPEVTGLSAGDYSVVVVDEEFCSQVISFKISEPNTPPLEVIVDSLSTESGDTYIQVSITGGKPPYLFFWTKDGETFSDLEDLEDLGPGIYQLIVRDDGGCQIASDEFDFRGVTSSREPNELDRGLTLFPNPVGEHLYIRKELPFNQPIQVQLIDMLGRKVYQGVFPAGARQFSIDVQEFAAGFYWARFRMDVEESSQKIIIN